MTNHWGPCIIVYKDLDGSIQRIYTECRGYMMFMLFGDIYMRQPVMNHRTGQWFYPPPPPRREMLYFFNIKPYKFCDGPPY